MCSIVPELTTKFDELNIYDWIPSEKQLKVDIEKEVELLIATKASAKVKKALNCLNCCCGFDLVDILLQVTLKEVGKLYNAVEDMKKNMLTTMEDEIKRKTSVKMIEKIGDKTEKHIEKIGDKAEKHIDKVGNKIMKQFDK